MVVSADDPSSDEFALIAALHDVAALRVEARLRVDELVEIRSGCRVLRENAGRRHRDE